MLISCVITSEITQPIRPRYINVTNGQTDGQLTIAISRFALRAWCGKGCITRSTVSITVARRTVLERVPKRDAAVVVKMKQAVIGQ